MSETPSRTWWQGLTREEFEATRKAEQPRMDGSHFGRKSMAYPSGADREVPRLPAPRPFAPKPE